MKQAIDVLCELVKASEGCRLTAYPDPGTGCGPYTVGYGQTGKDIHKGTVWTQQQADEALEQTLILTIDQVLKASPSLATATPSRLAAVCDFVYNCGLANYKKSTLKKYVDQALWQHSAVEILKWNKAAGKVMKGLTVRRQKEADLLLK